MTAEIVSRNVLSYNRYYIDLKATIDNGFMMINQINDSLYDPFNRNIDTQILSLTVAVMVLFVAVYR